MKKLISIEWKKISGHRFFWIGTALYLFCMILLITKFGSIRLFESNEEGGSTPLKTFGEAGFYLLPYIWHNISYLAGFFKFIPAFIIVFFISNEFQNKTMRQNIIDGLSISQYYWSKLISIIFFTVLSTLIIGLTGFIAASAHNSDIGFGEYFSGISYLFAFSAEILFFFCFALFVNVLFRRSAIAIVIILAYYFILEPVIGLIIGKPYSTYLPTRPSRELIAQPFTKMFQADSLLGLETVDKVPFNLLLVSLLYTCIFAFGGYWILKNRDVT